MRNRRLSHVLCLLLVLVLAACGGEAEMQDNADTAADSEMAGESEGEDEGHRHVETPDREAWS